MKKWRIVQAVRSPTNNGIVLSINMICIDDFRLHKECQTHILTHAHTDHMIIPKKFSKKILCSPLTATLTRHPQLQPVKPGWNNDMFIFRTNHVPGAIGVFYDHTLHVGENRLTEKQLDKIVQKISGHEVHTVVYDDFLEDSILWSQRLPSFVQSKNMLKKLLGDRSAHVVLRHFGMINCLPKNMSYKWQREPDSNREHIIVRAASHLKLSKHAKITLSFENVEDARMTIIPGIGYFRHFELPVTLCTQDDDGCWHLPFSCHPNVDHYEQLSSIYPEAELIGDSKNSK